MMNCQPQNRKRRNKQFPVCRTDKNPLGTKGRTSILSYREYVRPGSLHSRSAEENCSTENVATLRSVKVATPPCAAKATIPCVLAVREQHKMLFAASKFEIIVLIGGQKMKKTISVLLAVAMIFSLCACSQNKQSGISIKPTEFSEETLEVLDLFDDEIQFFDISLDENVKSFESSVWVYRDGEWFEDGKTHGNNDSLGKRIAIRLTENSYELYNISDNGHEKYSYPSLDTPFEESMGIGYSKIDREIPIELNKEIPICVRIGTSSNRMEVLDITEDFRKIECDAGIAVTITVSDEIVE